MIDPSPSWWGVDEKYKNLIRHIVHTGEVVTTRNSLVRRTIGCARTFSSTPLVCVRKTAWKSALREWEWFMSGSNNINDLHESVQEWWRPWADKNGEVENNYSDQFRKFYGCERNRFVEHRNQAIAVDQILALIDGITNHPFSRRNVITTWNTAEMVHPSTPITNCHGTIIQCFVSPQTNKLDLLMYQRSVDVICGLPHNWIQYWAFLLWLARVTERQVGSFQWIGGDVHIYDEHKDIVAEILRDEAQECPQLVYTPTSEDFKADDFTLDREYQPKVLTKAKMIV
jgi:thymidylate synthase